MAALALSMLRKLVLPLGELAYWKKKESPLPLSSSVQHVATATSDRTGESRVFVLLPRERPLAALRTMTNQSTT